MSDNTAISFKSKTIKMYSKWSGVSRFFNLLFALVYKDISARYRRSILGPLWAILQPFILMVLFTMIRGFVNIPSDGIPYPIFSYSALLPWTFFSNAVVYAGPSVYVNGNIIKKISVPREIFPLAAVFVALFDFAMAGIVMAGMMVYFKIHVSWPLLWLPLLLLIIIVFAFGVGMFVAAFGTYKRDVIFATAFLMQFWLYATPVIYPLSSVPERWRSLYMINPMVGIIEGFRKVLVKAQAPTLETLIWSIAMTGVALILFWLIFRWFSRYFADVI